MKYAFAVKSIAAAIIISSALSVSAQEQSTPEATYADIETTLGGVPTHLKSYPKSAISGAWAMSKGLLFGGENSLDAKEKALINLAVAAQIPCRYCVWLETKSAKAAGASDAELSEAVAQAAYVRHWSTVLNGLQIDFETFKSEFGGD